MKLTRHATHTLVVATTFVLSTCLMAGGALVLGASLQDVIGTLLWIFGGLLFLFGMPFAAAWGGELFD